tara:strand:- start:68 stop:286 length:219 start_codon:yes stop_codon:yes gene_type:complete
MDSCIFCQELVPIPKQIGWKGFHRCLKGHASHYECLKQWNKEQNKKGCPECKYNDLLHKIADKCICLNYKKK